MIDLLILLLIILMCLVGLRTVIKHMKGEGGGCCNTSDKPLELKKKHHGPITNTLVFKIEGMHCENCRIRVQNALNGIQGVVAHVNLKKEQALLECEKRIDPYQVIWCVQEVGYQASPLDE